MTQHVSQIKKVQIELIHEIHILGVAAEMRIRCVYSLFEFIFRFENVGCRTTYSMHEQWLLFS